MKKDEFKELKHTADIGTGTYDIIKLRKVMDELPVRVTQISSLGWMVGKQHKYWLDTNGTPLGPYEILSNWKRRVLNEVRTYFLTKRSSLL